MRPMTRAKLAAYKRHWKSINQLQDEMLSRDVNLDFKVGDTAEAAGIGKSTVSRFFHRGKGSGYKGYSLFHGPSTTTTIGIANALGFDVVLRRREATVQTVKRTGRRKPRVQFL